MGDEITRRQKSSHSWIGHDIDGWKVPARRNGDQWHWRIRPPGGGYDLFTGTAPSLERAKTDAEKQFEDLKKQMPFGKSRA